jgi:hypothetical protein
MAANMMKKAAACTIISCNYAAYARTLQDSLAKSNPDIELFVLVVDRKSPEFEAKANFNHLVWVEDLGVPGFMNLAFKFDILELNTNVKPFMLQSLAKQFEFAFYIDPDIFVYGSLNGLMRRLDGNTAIITPHSTSPIEDSYKPGETDFMKSGAYNLGFIGVRACAESRRLLDWWGRRCIEKGYNDARQGLFVDQRFVDLMPSFFYGVIIERNPAYNVAYWNLHERKLTLNENEQPWVNDTPLVFFHFSGLSVDIPTEARLQISKYQNRSNFSNRPDVKPLFECYRDKLIENGHYSFCSVPYGFSNFSNGERINSVSRRLYGLSQESFATDEDPFDADGTVYRMLSKCHALGGGPARQTPSTYNAHHQSRALIVMQILLRLVFRILGAERYMMLMAYLGHISSIRNQYEVFFSEKLNVNGKVKSDSIIEGRC